MNNKIYIQTGDGKYEKLGTLGPIDFIPEKDDAFDEVVCKGWNPNNTYVIAPTYKKWYKKKKGKRYGWFYKNIQGFDPKLIKKLIGGKDE